MLEMRTIRWKFTLTVKREAQIIGRACYRTGRSLDEHDESFVQDPSLKLTAFIYYLSDMHVTVM